MCPVAIFRQVPIWLLTVTDGDGDLSASSGMSARLNRRPSSLRPGFSPDFQYPCIVYLNLYYGWTGSFLKNIRWNCFSGNFLCSIFAHVFQKERSDYLFRSPKQGNKN